MTAIVFRQVLQTIRSRLYWRYLSFSPQHNELPFAAVNLSCWQLVMETKID